MAESTEVVVWRFTRVIDVSLQIQGLEKDGEINWVDKKTPEMYNSIGQQNIK